MAIFPKSILVVLVPPTNTYYMAIFPNWTSADLVPLVQPRYINKDLEEGKPNSWFSDYLHFPGDSVWLALLGEHCGERLDEYRRASASGVQPAGCSPSCLPRQDSRNFEIVRKSSKWFLGATYEYFCTVKFPKFISVTWVPPGAT